MNYKTHHVAALIAGEAVLLHYQQPFLTWQAPVALLAAYFMGPVADIDKHQSHVGQKTWFFSHIIELLGVRHRTVTHCFLFMTFLWFVIFSLPIPPLIKWAAWFGFITHPLVDLLNEQGVELLWPIRTRIKLLPGMLAIPVDSPQEAIFRLCLIVVSLLLLTRIILPSISQIPLIGGILEWIFASAINLLPAFLQNIIIR